MKKREIKKLIYFGAQGLRTNKERLWLIYKGFYIEYPSIRFLKPLIPWSVSDDKNYIKINYFRRSKAVHLNCEILACFWAHVSWIFCRIFRTQTSVVSRQQAHLWRPRSSERCRKVSFSDQRHWPVYQRYGLSKRRMQNIWKAWSLQREHRRIV